MFVCLISAMTIWKFLMVVQMHHLCWEVQLGAHIVVILCHQAISLQATISALIFSLIKLSLKLASNWNIMQQVRIHTK